MKAWRAASVGSDAFSSMPSGLRTASVDCGGEMLVWDADLLLPVRFLPPFP